MKKTILVFALLAASTAYAGDEETAVVRVSGQRNPDMRSYRSIVAGLDAFDEYHRLAPAVPEARFRLDPRHGGDVDPATLSLRIVGNGEPIPLTFAADGSFTVPRVQSALDDGADVVLNRRKGELEGRPDIRTPGLPANVRRLGDLRLECRVQLAIIKSELNFLIRAMVNTLLMSTDWCSAKNGKFWFPAQGVLADGVIVDGARRVPVEVQQKGFLAPIGDASWPDDARIELQLEPELTAEQKSQPWLRPIYLMGSMNHWSHKNRMDKTEAGVYKIALQLPAGRNEFKVGSANFDGIDLGGTLGAPLVTRGSNLVLNVEREGSYDFVLDARNSEAPVLTVTRSGTL